MTNFTFFAIAFLSCILFFIMGRMSVINDINRKLKPFKTQKFPIINMGNLYRALRTIISDYDFSCNAFCKVNETNTILHNENEELQAKYDKMSEEYKDVLKQLKDKRDELDKTHVKYLEYNNQVCNKAIYLDKITDQLHDSLIDYGNKIDKCAYSAIYATKMKNKQIVLSIGQIEIAANGKITHDENCRTLGLVNSKENQWASGVDIPHDMAIGAPVLVSVIYHKNVMQKLTKPMGELVKKASEISLKGNELNCYSLSNIHLI